MKRVTKTYEVQVWDPQWRKWCAAYSRDTLAAARKEVRWVKVAHPNLRSRIVLKETTVTVLKVVT